MLQTKIYRNMSKILYFQVSDMSPILAITSRSSFTLVSLNESMPWIRWESDLFFSFRNQPQHHLYRSTYKIESIYAIFFLIVEAINALNPYTRNMKSLFNQGGAKHSHFLSTSTNIHTVDLKDC